MTFTIPAFTLLMFSAFLGGMVFGIWMLLNKIK